MVNILATGGLGFIGSHTCVELLALGHEIIIIDSLINSSEKTLKKIHDVVNFRGISEIGKVIFKKGDIRDKLFLKSVFHEAKINNKNIEAVIHFAGLKSVSQSILSPINYWDVNFSGTINLLKIMNEYSCRKMIFSSSATVYKPINKLISENSDLKPKNPYGNTKLAIERFLHDIYNSGLNRWAIANLRYFNPVGADSSGLLGEKYSKITNNLFPILIKVANKELNSLPIFGRDWPTKDGTCIRDYIHITDLANAHIAALNLILENKEKYININIGTGRGFSVLEVIEKFKEVNGCDIPFHFSKRRSGDAPYVVADNSLAKTLLRWKTKRSLKEMCLDSWQWEKKNIKSDF